jgi:AraC family transcriptional regulator of adaptative response / DNA-3-methyladenine glycosylase II
MLDAHTCYTALTARDTRFDGLFFVGVKTTGIYCRPICAARTPRRERCLFFRAPAEAERAGYRACFRCRPELAPGNAPVDAVPRLVAQAVARIEEGYLNEHGVEELAEALGVTSRHLRRAMEDELGVAPVELAQSRRLALAKQLLQDTTLSLADVAFASGFQSIRRFNALFAERFGRPPSGLRRARGSEPVASSIQVRLDFRPPFDWRALLDFLRGRAIPGVERVSEDTYERVVRAGDKVGRLAVRLDGQRHSLRADIPLALAGSLMWLVARLRELFDLDARPEVIGEVLSRDALLAPLVARRPGLRVPGAFEPFEMAVRAVLGQQVSVRAATTLAGRLVERFGTALTPEEAAPGLTHVFPTPAMVAGQSLDALASIGLPRARAESLHALAAAFASKALHVDRAAPVEETARQLETLPSVGPWTAQYIAMRALHSPDAFPASDLGIRKALGGLSTKAVLERAEAWRPWRAYAVLHLWTSLSEGGVA